MSSGRVEGVIHSVVADIVVVDENLRDVRTGSRTKKENYN